MKLIGRNALGPSIGDHVLDRDAIPDSTCEELSRVIFREVKEFFSKPEIARDYKKWLAEYRATHPAKSEGGET